MASNKGHISLGHNIRGLVCLISTRHLSSLTSSRLNILFRILGRTVASWTRSAKASSRKGPQHHDSEYVTTQNYWPIRADKTVWGALLMTTPACHNFAGIATNRFLLGFVEAIVNPGFVLMMSMWYTAIEQPLRLEAYYCTNGIATMFGG